MEMCQPALPSLAEFGPPQTFSQSDLGCLTHHRCDSFHTLTWNAKHPLQHTLKTYNQNSRDSRESSSFPTQHLLIFEKLMSYLPLPNTQKYNSVSESQGGIKGKSRYVNTSAVSMTQLTAFMIIG